MKDKEKGNKTENPLYISLEKYDDCCFYISIKQNRKEIERGMWCPKTHRVVVNGYIIGLAKTAKEVKTRLRSRKQQFDVFYMD